MINLHTTPIEACSVHQFANGVFRKYAIDPKSDRPILGFDSLTPPQAQFLVDIINFPTRTEYQSIKVFDRYDVPTLVDYLKRSHREYLYQRLPEIEQTVDILLRGLSESPQLSVALTTYFEQYRNELKEHIELEENLLFPYALQLAHSGNAKGSNYSSTQFLSEHSDPSIEIDAITRLFKNFIPNGLNASPYRILLEQFNSFDMDLKIHELIEENVLVAKLIELEV